MISLDLIKTDYPTGVLRNAFGRTFDVQSGFQPSTIQFSIPRDDADTMDLKAGSTISVRVDGKILDTDFFLEGRATDYVTEDGVMARQFNGRSHECVFEDDVVMPSAWPNPVPSGHSFRNSTPGTIVKTLISRSQERGFLQELETQTFSGTTDSNGVDWPSMMDRDYANGDSLLQMIQDLVSQGQMDAKLVGSDLRLYLPGTLGKTVEIANGAIRPGQNALQGTVTEDASDFATDIFAIGDGDAAVQKTRPALYDVLGRRRSRFAQYGGITDSGLVGILADLELDQYAHIKTEHDFSVDHLAFNPFHDFDVYDWVYTDTRDGIAKVQISQISISESEDSFSVGLTLGDLLETADVKLKNRIDAITGTNAGGGSVPIDKQADKLPPAAPDSVSVDSIDYLDTDNTRKVAAVVDWPDVNKNSDGSPADDIDHYEFKYRTGTSKPSGTPTALAPMRPNKMLNALFDRRGKTGTQWLGGDGANSLRLPSGKDLWVFSDSSIGVPSAAGGIDTTKPWGMVNNSFVRTDPSNAGSFESLYGVPNLLPLPMSIPGYSGAASDYWSTYQVQSPVVVATNMCPNPTFKNGVATTANGGWDSGNTSTVMTASSDWALDPGGKSLKIVPNSTSHDTGTWMDSRVVGTFVVGHTYTVTAWCHLPAVQADTSNGNCRSICITPVGGSVASRATAPNTVGDHFVSLTFTYDASWTSGFWIRLYNGQSNSHPDPIYWDHVLIVEGSSAPAYFDGDTVSTDGLFTYAWTGAAGQSTSTKTSTGAQCGLVYSGDWPSSYWGTSLKVTTAPYNTYTWGVRAMGSPAVPVVAGDKVTARFTYANAANVRQVRAVVDWLDASGTYLSNNAAAYQAGSLTAQDYYAVLDVPSGAYQARLSVDFAIPTNSPSEVHYLDKLGLFQGEHPWQAWSATTFGKQYESLITPTSMGVKPDAGFDLNDYWVWIGDSFQGNGKVYVTAMLLRKNTHGSADYANQPGTWLLQWDAATMTFEKAQKINSDTPVLTDLAYVEGSYAYLYGHTASSISNMYLARVVLSDPFNTAKLQWWNGTLWVSSFSAAVVAVTQNISAIHKIGSVYHALYITGYSKYIQQLTGPTIAGPWTADPVNVYLLPEAGGSVNCYIPRFHPQFDTADGLVVGYSQNTTADWTKNISHSGPRFATGAAASPIPVGIDDAEWSGISQSVGSKVLVSKQPPDTSFQAQVRTIDSGGLASPSWTLSPIVVLTGDESATLEPPSTPIVTPMFQGARVTWDGLDDNGNPPSGDWAAVEVHISIESADFTPSGLTRVDSLPVYASGSGPYVSPIPGLAAATNYWVRLVAVGKSGAYSLPSKSVSVVTDQLVTADLANKLIEAANIADGAINVENLNVAAWSEQLIPNGDFESDEWAEGIPYGWSEGWWVGSGDTSPTKVTGADAIGGKNSWQHTITPGNGRQYLSQMISVTPGDIYYFSTMVKSSRPVTGCNVMLIYGKTLTDNSGFPPDSASVGPLAPVTGGTTAQKVEGQATIPEDMHYACIALILYPDDGAADNVTVTVDAVSVKHIVGTANIANAAINNAKIHDLAVDNAKISDLSASKITVGVLSADVTVSARIKTADAGARVEINVGGLQAFDSSNALVTQVGTDGGLVSRWFRTNTSGARIEMGTYATQGGGAYMSFYPTTGTWQFPSAVGWGVETAIGGASAYPGVAMHSGSKTVDDYNKYGLSMIALDQQQGISLITGNKLDGTEATTGTDITIDAGGSQGEITLRAGGDDRNQLHLIPGTTGQSFLQMNGGMVNFSTADDPGNMIYRANTAWGSFNAYHMVMVARYGLRVVHHPSDGSGDTDIFTVLPSGLINGSGDWGTPKIKCRATNDWIQWDNKGNAYVNGSATGLSTNKTFVIDHPTDPDRYLAHACIEGPTSDVFYRGNDTAGLSWTKVMLPKYFPALIVPGSCTLTTQVYDSPGMRSGHIQVSRVDDAEGFFWVRSTTGAPVEFSWMVVAERKGTRFDVEPSKKDNVRLGDGPYTYLKKKVH